MKATAGPICRRAAAGAILAAIAWPGAGLADDPYGYRLKDRNRAVFSGPTGVNLYPRQPYRSPLYQPRKRDFDPDWKPAPGLNPLLTPRRDLRPWRPR